MLAQDAASDDLMIGMSAWQFNKNEITFYLFGG